MIKFPRWIYILAILFEVIYSNAQVTLVNYDFNSGASYAAISPSLASGITSSISSTESFTTFGGSASGGSAFSSNGTAGNAIAMSNSSGTDTRYWDIAVGGVSLSGYTTIKIYFQAQRSGTGATTVTVTYSLNGGSYTAFASNTMSPGNGSFVQALLSLPALVDNPTSLTFRLSASGASGSGTLRIDNFQVQGVAAPSCSAPSTQATSISFSSVTPTSTTVSWTRGNGDAVLVVAKQGATPTGPVNSSSYLGNSIFSSGNDLGSSSFVVYTGTGNSINITGLASSASYSYSVFEYNTTSGTCYNLTALTGSQSTSSCTTPTNQSTVVGITNIAVNSLNLSWVRGNGTGGVIVLAKAGSAITDVPLSGTTYSGNSNFSAASSLGASKILYVGTGTSLTVTGLSATTTYYFKVFEFNTASMCYITTGNSNTTTGTTVCNPTDVTAVITIPGSTKISLTWTAPTCYDEVMIIAKSGSAVTSIPTGDGNSYFSNPIFGTSGTDVGLTTSEYAVFKSSSQNNVIVKGLINSITYHFKIFTRKGTLWSSGVPFYITPVSIGGTSLNPGDMVIVGYDSYTDEDGDGTNGDDVFVIMTLVDLYPGTEFIVANATYEPGLAAGVSNGVFGGSCGGCQLTHMNFTVGGTTIPKGSVISFVAPNQTAANPVQIKINNVATSNITGSYYGDNASFGRMNISSSNADQIYLMQGRFASNASNSVSSSTFYGNILYAINNGANWVGFNSTTAPADRSLSRLPEQARCFNLENTGSLNEAKQHNIGSAGVLVNASHRNLIINISNQSNWTSKGTTIANNLNFSLVNSPQTGYTVTGTAPKPGNWVGDGDLSWYTCRNWDNLSLPTYETDVSISGSALAKCVVDSKPSTQDTASCNNLLINYNDGSNKALLLENDDHYLRVYGSLTLTGTSGEFDMKNGSQGGHLFLYGNWENQANDTQFNDDNAKVYFRGSTDQTIKNTNTNFEKFGYMYLKKSGGKLILNSNIDIEAGLNLSYGLIVSSSTGTLTLRPSASVSGTGNANCYVNGPYNFRKASSGSTTFICPIGKYPDWRPIELTVNHSSTTDYTYVAEQFNSSALNLGYNLQTATQNINLVSGVRYYDVTRYTTSGMVNTPSTGISGNAIIKIYYDISDGVTDPANLVIAKNTNANPTNWYNIGGTGATYGSGSVTSSSTAVNAMTNFTSFSRFALANSITGINPLPTQIINISGKTENNYAKLEWNTTGHYSKGFEIEKSLDAISFVKLGESNSSNSYFTFIDYDFYNNAFYRVKLKNTNEYSSTVYVADVISENPIKIYPNPASDNITIYSYEEIKKASIINISNNQFLTLIPIVKESNNYNYTFNISNLSKGLYFLKIETATGAHLRKLMIQ
ncbi:MAG: T9SS type A sorting domain-containing protein [Bacteroidota bacterium]|nr:T9SS type A sorting domain-containing protein [Bacteroidota bacterium]